MPEFNPSAQRLYKSLGDKGLSLRVMLPTETFYWGF
jgi:hypothetical protein